MVQPRVNDHHTPKISFPCKGNILYAPDNSDNYISLEDSECVYLSSKNNAIWPMNYIKYVILIFFAAGNAYAQNLSERDAEKFLNLLINESDELVNFVDKNELRLSQRFEISYPDVKFKFLISNDMDSSIKFRIRNQELKYEYKIRNIDDDLSILKLIIPSIKSSQEYFFLNSKLISKPSFYARKWIHIKSRFFEFFISRNDLTNDYAAAKLDSFVLNALHLLQFNEAEILKLEKEKIHYFLCSDESEIEQLTGYKARGLYFLAYDYIISTYNSHYHEVLHLLMNYKLRSISLYTLPFLQEGFAAGYGGRGGLDVAVILDMGYFLSQNGFIDHKSLLSKKEFDQTDASMSYPVSGLYTRFLIQSNGIEKFIEHYRKYSVTVSQIDNLKINITELPEETEWIKFLSASRNTLIKIRDFNDDEFKKSVIEADEVKVFETDDEYLFMLKKDAFINGSVPPGNYRSNLFTELFPGRIYKGEKYIIRASTEEISVYNVLTNILIAKYVRSFSADNEPVQQKAGFFVFTLQKKLFDEPILSIWN